MLFGRAQLKTIEPSETIFKLIPDICQSLNANLKHINDTSYYIYARLEEPYESLFEWGFHILLKKEKKDTEIDLFVEYEGLFEPSRKFIQDLLDTLEKRIPIKKALHPNDWGLYEIEKTEDGLIGIDGKMEEVKGSIRKKILQPTIEFKYDVKPLGNYTNKTTKKIEKLFILIGEIHEIQLKKEDPSPPLYVIQYENIRMAEAIKYDKGLFHLASYVLSISFYDNTPTESAPDSFSDLYEEEFDHALILETKKQNDITTIIGQLTSILDAKEDRKKKLRLLASLQGTHLCTICCINPIAFSFSFEQICGSCFVDKYGKMKLSLRNGEYHGGHKVLLAGGKFSECEYGNMYLTERYFIFHKIYQEADKKENWEIVIPFKSVQIEQWGLQEGSRRKNVLLGGTSEESYGFGGGFITESGKRHRLVIPYFDENGIKHAPVFGASSRKGDMIKLLAASIYNAVVETIKTHPDEENIREDNDITSSDPLVILKTRFAKGEISKAEFEEMKELLE